jgi:hypothetical protein
MALASDQTVLNEGFGGECPVAKAFASGKGTDFSATDPSPGRAFEVQG